MRVDYRGIPIKNLQRIVKECQLIPEQKQRFKIEPDNITFNSFDWLVHKRVSNDCRESIKESQGNSVRIPPHSIERRKSNETRSYHATDNKNLQRISKHLKASKENPKPATTSPLRRMLRDSETTAGLTGIPWRISKPNPSGSSFTAASQIGRHRCSIPSICLDACLTEFRPTLNKQINRLKAR